MKNIFRLLFVIAMVAATPVALLSIVDHHRVTEIRNTTNQDVTISIFQIERGTKMNMMKKKEINSKPLVVKAKTNFSIASTWNYKDGSAKKADGTAAKESPKFYKGQTVIITLR